MSISCWFGYHQYIEISKEPIIDFLKLAFGEALYDFQPCDVISIVKKLYTEHIQQNDLFIPADLSWVDIKLKDSSLKNVLYQFREEVKTPLIPMRGSCKTGKYTVNPKHDPAKRGLTMFFSEFIVRCCAKCGEVHDPRIKLAKIISRLSVGLRMAKENEASGLFSI